MSLGLCCPAKLDQWPPGSGSRSHACSVSVPTSKTVTSDLSCPCSCATQGTSCLPLYHPLLPLRSLSCFSPCPHLSASRDSSPPGILDVPPLPPPPPPPHPGQCSVETEFPSLISSRARLRSPSLQPTSRQHQRCDRRGREPELASTAKPHRTVVLLAVGILELCQTWKNILLTPEGILWGSPSGARAKGFPSLGKGPWLKNLRSLLIHRDSPAESICPWTKV